jgi:crotonobetainyl-CoA:carnitine CoA-transferase CaiB-like acyl-CoA transferase
VADSSAGNYAAVGILIALAERERSGEGQWITTSLLQAQIAMMDFQAARYLVDGEVPPQAGNDHPYVTPTGAFATSDGYINIALGQKQWPDFCKALGRTDLTEHADYVSQEQRFRNRPALNRELEKAFKTRKTQEWLDLLEPLGIPAGPIYRVNEVFDDAQVIHLGMAAPVHHPVRGDIRVVASPVGLSRTPAKVVTPTPEAGEHTQELLAEIGITGAEVERLRTSKVI